jgi:hypothetical protein
MFHVEVLWVVTLCSVVKMQAAWTSEHDTAIHNTIRGHNPENLNF